MRGRRVVITGMGAFTPLGPTFAESWRGVVRGRKFISVDGKNIPIVDKIQDFDMKGMRTQIAAQIRYPWSLSDRFSESAVHKLQKTGRFGKYAMMASHEALSNARLLNHEGMFKQEYQEYSSVAIGTAVGGIREIAECVLDFSKRHDLGQEERSRFIEELREKHSYASLKVFAGTCAYWPSILFGAKGGVISNDSACATGVMNAILAYEDIKNGHNEIVLTGGTDDSVSETVMLIFSFLGATTSEINDPTCASKPFDKNRDGFVVSEGASILVFEELEHALSRGAPILAEIVGWGKSSDATHPTSPTYTTQAKAIEKALKNSGINPRDIDYINPHATSTTKGDLSEVKAIKAAFGEDLARKIPVGAIKSTIGHMFGADGAFGIQCCVEAIQEGVIPPTSNYETPDPECDLDCVPNKARSHRVDTAMKISFAFGGQNSVVIIRRFVK